MKKRISHRPVLWCAAWKRQIHKTEVCGRFFFCIGNEPKSGLARDLGDCLQSRNVPFGTSGDLHHSNFANALRSR